MTTKENGFWISKCDVCGNKELIGIEYWYTSPNRYDGVSEWLCKKCGTRFGRWSGIVLKEGEEEGRYGEGSPVKMNYTDETLKATNS